VQSTVTDLAAAMAAGGADLNFASGVRAASQGCP
jgi:hypothetical protein